MGFKPLPGYLPGSSPTFTDVIVTGDLTVQGNFNFGDVSSDALTVNGTLHLNDNVIQSFGNTAVAPDAMILFSTYSPGANCLRLGLPTASMDNIPYLVIGDYSTVGTVEVAGFGSQDDPAILMLSKNGGNYGRIQHDGSVFELTSSAGVTIVSSGDISLTPGNMLTSTVNITNSVATFTGVNDTTTIYATVPNAQSHYGSIVTLDSQSTVNLTGQAQVAIVGYFTNSAVTTVTNAIGVVGEVDNITTGVITDAAGFLAVTGNQGAGSIGKFTAFQASEAYVGTASSYRLIKADADYVQNNCAFIVEAGGAPSPIMYIPLSTAATGLTMDSADLNLATTTSGNIVFTPADGSYSYGYTTKTDPSGSFTGWSFDTYITLTGNSTAYGNGFTATLSLEHAGFDITGPQVVMTSFYYNYDKAGTVSKAVNYRAEMWNYGFAGAGNITDAVAFQGYVDEQSGEITKWTLLEGLASPGGQVQLYNVLSLTEEYTSNTYTIANTINSAAAYIPFSTANTGITWVNKSFTLATTTSGNITINSAGSLELYSGSASYNALYSYSGDYANPWVGTYIYATIDNTADSAYSRAAFKAVLVAGQDYNLTATGSLPLIGAFGNVQAAVGNSKTITRAVGVMGGIEKSNAGTLTEGYSFMSTASYTAGTLSNYYSFYASDFSAGTPTNQYLLRADSGYTSNSYTLKAYVSSAAGYIPFSTVDTGITWASRNLVLATTTSGDIQLTPAGKIDLNGSQKVKRTVVSSATHNAATTEYLLAVTYTATGTVAITLPAAATAGAGFVYVIKDEGGNAGTYNITVDANGSETIDGSLTAILNADYDSMTIYSDGSNWQIIQ